jgi:S-formylglutathione hydrolase
MYLSGLTCSDENVCQKSGIFKTLSELQMGFVAPDTSPRGAGVEGETESWDFGQGAGFYVDATTEKWSNNYRMYTYVTKELPKILSEHFPSLDQTRMGITGHSMGGHGALTIAFKNPAQFKSVSAFSPICNPMKGAWGQKALGGYLGDSIENMKQWLDHDA